MSLFFTPVSLPPAAALHIEATLRHLNTNGYHNYNHVEVVFNLLKGKIDQDIAFYFSVFHDYIHSDLSDLFNVHASEAVFRAFVSTFPTAIPQASIQDEISQLILATVAADANFDTLSKTQQVVVLADWASPFLQPIPELEVNLMFEYVYLKHCPMEKYITARRNFLTSLPETELYKALKKEYGLEIPVHKHIATLYSDSTQTQVALRAEAIASQQKQN